MMAEMISTYSAPGTTTTAATPAPPGVASSGGSYLNEVRSAAPPDRS